MKLSTNEIRAKLMASEAFVKHLGNWANIDQRSLVVFKAHNDYFTPALCAKVADACFESRLAATAETLYVQQWNKGFDIERAITFYLTFDARKIDNAGNYQNP